MCGSCEREVPLLSRDLCKACYQRLWCRDDGSLEAFGWVRADRLAEFRLLRKQRYPVELAGARVGVSARTAWRYEAARFAPVSPERAEENRGVPGEAVKGAARERAA